MERLLLRVTIYTLGLLRWLLGHDSRTYAVLTIGALQPLLESMGRLRAREVLLKAHAECPAYREFLAAHAGGRVPRRWSDVPVTTKENYVRAYSIEARCFGGRLAGGGEVIDESSGSSGVPNNWVRSAAERHDVRKLLQLSYGMIYGDRTRILLNCFALGPWATGMNVSMSLADVGTLKSIGPDAAKLEATLRVFGPSYRYLVFGYPPFVKSFVDGCRLDLAPFHLDLVVGGEGITETLRHYLRRSFRTVVSSYGASDLEINLGVETEWTIALRARCAADPALCTRLFGRDTPPMIFQYNPLDYLVERLPGGELAFTVCRVNGAAPKVRYNLKDEGGTWTWRALARVLHEHGIVADALAARRGRFPLLWVYGRSDLTVAFFGAKLYPADVEAVVLGEPALARSVRSFQFASVEDERADRRLVIDLERAPDAATDEPGLDPAALAAVFYAGLAAANQDFREVRRMFPAGVIDVRLHPHGTGPFAGADVRLKNAYVRPPGPAS